VAQAMKKQRRKKMRKIILIAATVLTLSACSSTGNITGEHATGLSPSHTLIKQNHMLDKLNLAQKQKGLAEAAIEFDQTHANLVKAREERRLTRLENEREIARLHSENSNLQREEVEIDALIAHLLVQSELLNIETESANTLEQKIAQAIRKLEDRSAVSGEKIPLDGTMPLLLNNSGSYKKEWLAKIQSIVNEFNLIQNPIVTPDSDLSVEEPEPEPQTQVEAKKVSDEELEKTVAK
jgi:hypothetical protein